MKKAEDPEDGRLCCELYKKLPPRREFKDYYEVIEDPIDLQVCSFFPLILRVCARQGVPCGLSPSSPVPSPSLQPALSWKNCMCVMN